MKNILLPIDFSECSMHAFRYAYKLYRNKQCKYLFLYNSPIPQTNATIALSEKLREDTENTVHKQFLKFIDSLDDFYKADLNFKLEITFGNLETDIIKLTKTYNIHTVIMGTEGAFGIEKLWGTNAASLASVIETPIIIIPNKRDNFKPKNIVIAVDEDSTISSNAIQYLHELAFHHSSYNLLLYVSKTLDKDLPNKEEILHRFDDFTIEYKSMHNPKKESLLNCIRRLDTIKTIDLVVIFKQEHSFLENLTNLSNTKELSYSNEWPLLVFH